MHIHSIILELIGLTIKYKRWASICFSYFANLLSPTMKLKIVLVVFTLAVLKLSLACRNNSRTKRAPDGPDIGGMMAEGAATAIDLAQQGAAIGGGFKAKMGNSHSKQTKTFNSLLLFYEKKAMPKLGMTIKLELEDRWIQWGQAAANATDAVQNPLSIHKKLLNLSCQRFRNGINVKRKWTWSKWQEWDKIPTQFSIKWRPLFHVPWTRWRNSLTNFEIRWAAKKEQQITWLMRCSESTPSFSSFNCTMFIKLQFGIKHEHLLFFVDISATFVLSHFPIVFRWYFFCFPLFTSIAKASPNIYF